MKRLLSCVASAALIAGVANAQTPTNDEMRAMSPEQLKEALQGYELYGYRIEDDECGLVCTGTPAEAVASAQALMSARLASDATNDEAGANAPRIDFDAEDVVFREGRRYNLRTRSAPQTIFLKFDADEGSSPQFPVDIVDNETGEFIGQIFYDDYVFSQAERLEIRDRVAADYADFGVRVTTIEPTSGTYATIDYTDNDRAPGDANLTFFVTDDGRFGFSALFGRAEEIDFGNDNYDGGAFSDVSLWTALFEFGGPGAFEFFSTLPGTPEGLAEASLNQAANTGAHEVGHAVGLRHHDSFGAPDDGLPSTGRPAPGTFIPVFEGPTNADETILHLMASGASAGLPLEGSAVGDRFLSERSALKLRFAEYARVYDEAALRRDRRTGAKRLSLRRDLVPNTIVVGENAGGSKIAMDTAWVQGTLDGSGDVDEYAFTARRSMFINAEVISFSDSNVANPVIATLRLFRVNDNGSRTLISENLQTFEPFDPLLLDIEVPEFGDYILQVVPQEVVFLNGGTTPFPLEPTGNGQFLQGDYDLIVYQVDRPLGRSPRIQLEADE